MGALQHVQITPVFGHQHAARFDLTTGAQTNTLFGQVSSTRAPRVMQDRCDSLSNRWRACMSANRIPRCDWRLPHRAAGRLFADPVGERKPSARRIDLGARPHVCLLLWLPPGAPLREC
jgi:hypothetical protein